MSTTCYDHTKHPPAPILKIKLSAPGETLCTPEHTALVDTGGDYTTAPLDWLLQVDAPEVRLAYLRGLWSAQRAVTLYLVDLHFADPQLVGHVIPGVEVVGIPEDDIETADDYEIVLGRNVLNHLMLLLDGPREQCELLDRRPLKF